MGAASLLILVKSIYYLQLTVPNNCACIATGHVGEKKYVYQATIV